MSVSSSQLDPVWKMRACSTTTEASGLIKRRRICWHLDMSKVLKDCKSSFYSGINSRWQIDAKPEYIYSVREQKIPSKNIWQISNFIIYLSNSPRIPGSSLVQTPLQLTVQIFSINHFCADLATFWNIVPLKDSLRTLFLVHHIFCVCFKVFMKSCTLARDLWKKIRPTALQILHCTYTADMRHFSTHSFLVSRQT